MICIVSKPLPLTGRHSLGISLGDRRFLYDIQGMRLKASLLSSRAVMSDQYDNRPALTAQRHAAGIDPNYYFVRNKWIKKAEGDGWYE